MITRMDFVRRLLSGVAIVSLVSLPSVAGEGNNGGGHGGGNNGGGHHGGGSDPDPGPGGSGGHVE